jgi:hypothetical protein
MSFQDYIEQFKYLYICSIPPDTFTTSLKGEWSLGKDNCGGFIKLTDTFFKNPQYNLILPGLSLNINIKDIGPTRVFVSVQIRDKMITEDDMKKNSIGVYIFEGEYDGKSLLEFPKTQCVAQSSMKNLFRDGICFTGKKLNHPYGFF